MATPVIGEFSWERMFRAVENVRERLLRTAKTLEAAEIPYAIAGGNAVAAWVGRVDVGGVRNTPDVDVVVQREDFPKIIEVMTQAGFVHAKAAAGDMFLDPPKLSPRDAVHVLFAEENVRASDEAANPNVLDVVRMNGFNAVPLESLVKMKLVAFRLKDRVHIRDMLDVGVIDAGWVSRFSQPLAERLQQLIDDPEG